MEKLCLDTDFLVGLLRGKKDCIEFSKKAEDIYSMVTTIINVFELFVGAYKSKNQENLNKTRELINSLEVLMIDKTIAEKAAEISADLERQGMPIDFRDLLIAAAALAHDCKLKTFNIKHFGRIKGLAII